MNPYITNQTNSNNSGTTPGLATYLKKFKNFLFKQKEGTNASTDYEPSSQNNYTGMAGGIQYYADPKKVTESAGVPYSSMYTPSGSVKDTYLRSLSDETVKNVDPNRAYTFGPNGEAYNYAGEKLPRQTSTPKDTYVKSVAKPEAPITPAGAVSDPTRGMIGGTGTPVGSNTQTQGNVGQQPEVSATDSAFAEYLKALSPTSEEKTAYEEALRTKTRGISDIELARQSGETSAFAAGEEERVARNADRMTQTALDRYNMYKDLASSGRDIAKLKYERELAKENAKASLAKEGFTLSAGESRYSYNPSTGRYENVASIAPKATGGSTTTTGSTEKKMTEAERKNNAYSSINTLLSGGMIGPDGTPFTDDNGYITPKGAKTIMAEALSEGLSRKDFITNYGSYFYAGKKGKYEGYGLTPAEIKLIAE